MPGGSCRRPRRTAAIAVALAVFSAPACAARGSAVPAHPSTTSAPVTSPASAARAATVHYRFDDEFGGTRLNTSRWQANWLGTGSPVSEENNCYSPSQVSVGGGYLHLRAVRRTKGCARHPYVSGLVNTHMSFHFTTGYLEARVFLPATAGRIANWPAVWTDGYGNWPSTGESDVLEGMQGRACWAYHGPRQSDGADACPAGNFTWWHVFAESVTRTTTTYFYDGHRVGHSANVNAPHFLILNFAVPASGPLRIPSQMLVDYIRVR